MNKKIYEKQKQLTRGKEITRDMVRMFVSSLEIPEEDKKRLMTLSPETYIGWAAKF